MQHRRIIKVIIALSIIFSFNINALSLRDVALNKYRPSTIGECVSTIDGESYLQLQDNKSKIVKISFKTGEVIETIFDSATARNCKVTEWDGFIMSPDETKILLYTNSSSIYRHSFKADYYVFEIKRNNLKPLSTNGQQQIATFSPDARMIAFVRDNNIFVKKLDYDTELAVTVDGEKNKIVNGVSDWVYQEEFGFINSLAWSPDNLVLSFVKWNETEVPTYNIQMFEGACNPIEKNKLYPGNFEYKYPVAGATNSKVSVISYDVETRKLKEMNIPIDADGYIPFIQFAKSADRLMVLGLNRNQNLLQLFSVNPRSTESKLIYSDNSKNWINIENITTTIRFDENSFVIASEKSGFNHLYQYSNAGSLLRQLTTGDWNVTDYYGYDPILKSHYFQSTQDGAINRVVSKVDVKGIITKISKNEGTNSAIFSSNYAYYIENYSSATTPNQYAIWSNKGKLLKTLRTNDELVSQASNVLPKKEFFTFTSGSETFNGYMIKPNDFNPSKKYPVIMSQYSGPGSQNVLNKWSVDWEQYAASVGYIIVSVDGRGTGGRSAAWKHIVYMNLGKYETIDQIGAANYVASLPYVDANKIGIFGWSYGGYETLMATSQVNSPYKAGVAVAPVTDWRYYDTAYTERFMRTPQQNESGYKSSSAINAIKNQKGKLLIISGTADDNVHIANTYQYVAELTAQNKLCDMMVYPNMNHSINGCEVRYPLFMKIMDFFDSNLK